MLRALTFAALTSTLTLFSGCGAPSGEAPATSSTAATTNSAAKPEIGGKDPRQAAFQYLEANLKGDRGRAAALLTPLAREKTRQYGLDIFLDGSDEARFEIGGQQTVDGSTANVVAKWTEKDQDGKPVTHEIICSVRKTGSVWQVSGLAAKPFPDWPPVLMNYEDPEDLTRQKELVQQERMRRQASIQSSEARNPTDRFQSGPQ